MSKPRDFAAGAPRQLLPRALGTRRLRAGLRLLAQAVGFGAVLFGGGYLLVALADPSHAVDLAVLLARSALGGGLFGVGVGGYLLMNQTREVAAFCFRALALGATLFSLLMLAFLFFRLGADAVMWFRLMPAEIARSNREMASEAETYLEDEKRQLQKERDADVASGSDDKEKQEIRDLWDKKLIPEKLAERALIAQNKKEALQGQIRERTDPGSLLWHFLSHGPSENDKPQNAGILPALLGSIYLGLITVAVALPLGVGAAIYLEEYRATGWINKIIQVNINNLAAVPSVFYGIMGAFIFVELIFKNLQGELWTPTALAWVVGEERAKGIMTAIFGESIAARNLLGGGLSLAMLTLPVIIVSAQEALRAVPVSLRHAALALGATKWQSIWHVVLPQAKSGILTGVILSLSRAIGEAAPLVLFGALTLVTYNPRLLTPFTVMPLQIFNWADRPSELWRCNAGLASVVLMLVLLLLNAAAIVMRQRSRSVAARS